jgi:sarcosine oxidase
MSKRVAVVGAGIAGLCTAASLVERGVTPIVLERRRVAGPHGSSHGPSRITRSVYADAVYVRIMQRIHREHWPALQAKLKSQLLFKTDGLFFGHGELWSRYREAVLSQGVDVEPLDVLEARRRFPQFRMTTAESAIHDRTAAVIAADRVLRGLHRWLGERGVVVREDTSLLHLERRPDSVSLVLEGERIDVDAVVLCMGSWIGRIVPELKAELTVIRQTIAYFDCGDGERSRPPHSPVWVAVGDDEKDVFYGLPEFDRPGVKVARHRTVGNADSADVEDDPAEALADVESFAARELSATKRMLVGVERCLYTVSPTEDFVLGGHPEDSRIVIGSACSGHGFKFGPWTGEVLADFALHGGTEDADYLRERERFAPSRFWRNNAEADR